MSAAGNVEDRRAAWSADETALVAALRAGDEDAFEFLVRSYGPRLFAVVRRFLPQEGDAQDALQDAFISAYRALGKFQGDARLGTWLHRIAVNAALMKLRARRRHPERSIDDLLPQFLADGHRANAGNGWGASYDGGLEQRETRELVRKRIDELPDDYRAILLVRDIEERSTAEAAELLNLSESAVKTRLHRARLALRHLLDAQLREARA